MDNLPVIALSILAVLIMLGIIFWIITLRRGKEGRPVTTNYRALFVMGIVFTGAGIALSISTDNPGFYGMAAVGIVYLIVGLTNRDKWDDESK